MKNKQKNSFCLWKIETTNPASKLGVGHTTCKARQLWSIRSQSEATHSYVPWTRKGYITIALKIIWDDWCVHSAITVTLGCHDHVSWKQKWDALNKHGKGDRSEQVNNWLDRLSIWLASQGSEVRFPGSANHGRLTSEQESLTDEF